MKYKDATSIGFIGGIPDDADIKRLEKEWGEPIKKIEKDGKVILLVGRGLFKKKIVIPFEK
ncbi:MAG: hypothetical protein GX947_01275 [Tissierellia bacterium]|nr:hypothetical protein [Tissierellia bacterium]